MVGERKGAEPCALLDQRGDEPDVPVRYPGERRSATSEQLGDDATRPAPLGSLAIGTTLSVHVPDARVGPFSREAARQRPEARKPGIGPARPRADHTTFADDHAGGPISLSPPRRGRARWPDRPPRPLPPPPPPP